MIRPRTRTCRLTNRPKRPVIDGPATVFIPVEIPDNGADNDGNGWVQVCARAHGRMGQGFFSRHDPE